MSDAVVRVENLGKRYRIAHQGERPSYVALREVIADRVTSIFRPRRAASGLAPSVEDFWALKDVSFEIEEGTVVGIIGRNGAGKSTLLKVLSRITEPSEGRVRIRGRVASLLEVGTGFHPELTGRENVFLNGAVLGMTRAEIRKKFDAIVAFAEVEKFLDTPVKRYSSGMYVRLAFAVAAHLEPEILIVDEVLAVGDARFQQKCVGKMQEVSSGGRTVLFVSHNMLVVQKLCTHGILLEGGRLKRTGRAADIVSDYISTDSDDAYTNTPSPDVPRITALRVLTTAPRSDSELRLSVRWSMPDRVRGIKIGIGFNTMDGQRVFDSSPEDGGTRIPDGPGCYEAIFTVPPHTLMARNYLVSVGLWVSPSGGRSTVFDSHGAALRVAVEAGPGGPYSHQATRDGLVHVSGCEWNVLDARPDVTSHEQELAACLPDCD